MGNIEVFTNLIEAKTREFFEHTQAIKSTLRAQDTTLMKSGHLRARLVTLRCSTGAQNVFLIGGNHYVEDSLSRYVKAKNVLHIPKV